MFDATTEAGIEGAHVLALDDQASALTDIALSGADGSYELDVPVVRDADGVPIEVRHPTDARECIGVNSKAELAVLERRYQMSQASQLLEAGVTLADPARVDVRGELECGRDVSIDVNCIFEGRVTLGDGVKIGASCILRDVAIGAGTQVLPFSLIEEATGKQEPSALTRAEASTVLERLASLVDPAR